MNPQEVVDAARRDLREAERDLVKALAGNKTRQRAPFVRLLHEVRGMLNPARPFASQAGQDEVIDRLLGGKTGGVFVDVGGYDGVSGSNSLFFEKWRGWTGVIVEPVETFRAQAEAIRSAPCLPFAVAPQTGEAEFIAVREGYTQMSGLRDFYDSGLLEQVRDNARHKEDVITVQTRTLGGILRDSGIERPDFVSLDIEGGELAVLKEFPFEEFQPATWAIENNSGGPELSVLMRSNGYRLAEFCGPDEIYVHQDIR